MLKELLEFMAKSLVSDPDSVNVEVKETDYSIVLELSVAQEDMGKIIGKQGRIAKAIRAIVKAAASKQNLKYTVTIDEKQAQ